MSQRSVEFALSAAVATGGTFTVGYPEGFDRGDFEGAPGHNFMLGNMGPYNSPDDFTIAFGASVATITYNGATTLPTGVMGYFTFDIAGDLGDDEMAYPKSVREAHSVLIQLGSPDTSDADGVSASQAGTAATAMLINGALTSGGVATFDVPRNVVAAWTNTATITVTGTDEYGNTVVETSASGTSMAGKKAFKTITSVVPSANITGATVGTGDVLGLPVFLPGAGHVLSELQDGDVATAGTVVAGLSVNTESTATTADVRGTYDPNSACNGALRFELLVALPDPTHLGNAQFAG